MTDDTKDQNLRYLDAKRSEYQSEGLPLPSAVDQAKRRKATLADARKNIRHLDAKRNEYFSYGSSLPSAVDQIRRRKRFSKSTRVRGTQETIDNILLNKIIQRDYTIDGGLLDHMTRQGYRMYWVPGKERQLYLRQEGARMRYVSDHDFFTDKPSLCTILLENDAEQKIFEDRLAKRVGSVARLQKEMGRLQQSNPIVIFATSMTLGIFGTTATLGAYTFLGAEAGILAGVISIGVPSSIYMAWHVLASKRKGLLPQSFHHRQIVAADYPHTFASEVLKARGTTSGPDIA